MRAYRIGLLTVGALLCNAPLLVSAHHSLIEWDPGVIVELEGEVVEGSSLAHLDRRKVPRDAVEVGDTMRVSGSPSNRRSTGRRAHRLTAIGRFGGRL